MTAVLLIYPFFIPRRDRSVFRFPPLGVAYIAASLRAAGHEAYLLDCTFLDRDEALQCALAYRAKVVGIYCMVTMFEECLWFAEKLRLQSKLLVCGGPLPTCDPETFVDYFDLVVRGEGEQTMVEIVDAYQEGQDISAIRGVVYRERRSGAGQGELIHTSRRPFIRNLETLPFPMRDLLPNESYIEYGRKKYGYSITTVMSTRGCPYECEFCSNVVFGGSYRERPATNVADEIEEALRLGYDRIAFADDVFTLNRRRVHAICEEIRRRGLIFQWECLGRVDAIDYELAKEMKATGCAKIFFGIESGNDEMLKQMNKKITTQQAREAVEVAHQAGLSVGAFFIVCYPGDTDDTVMETLRFATSLPLDYLGLSMPYPLPGTALYKRVKQQITRSWRQDESLLWSHVLIYSSEFSERKMWLAILKGHGEFEIKRRLGKAAPVILKVFQKSTEALFRRMK